VRSERIGVAAGAPVTVGDEDGDGVPDLMVKFDRATVASWFETRCQATFSVIGNFADDNSLFKAVTGPVQIR
jgi:hypothetical protein